MQKQFNLKDDKVLRRLLAQAALPTSRGGRQNERLPTNVIKRPGKVKNILDNTKKQFPRLLDNDAKVFKELKKEFKPYSNNADEFFTMTAAVAAYLRATLNNEEIHKSNAHTAGGGNGILANRGDKPEAIYKKYYDDLVKQVISGGNHLAIKGNEVQVNMNKLAFNVPVVLNEDSIASLNENFKKLFPSFVAPTKYKRDPEDRTIKVDLGAVEKYDTGLKPFSFFAKLKFDKNPAPGNYQPDALELANPPNETISKALTIQVKIVDAKIVNPQVYAAADERGPIGKNQIVFTIQIMGVATVPLEYALWATNARDLTEFVPKLFREHFDFLGRVKLGGERFQIGQERTMHMGTVKQINEERIKEFGIVVKPRVNKDNFCILTNGDVFYVPPVDNTKLYVDILRKSYNPETKKVLNNSQIKEIHDLPIYADWINDAFGYTNSDGKPSAQSLRGAIALDEVTIGKHLGRTLAETDVLIGGDNYKNYASSIAAEFNLYDKTAANHNSIMNLAASYAGLYSYLVSAYGSLPIWQLMRASDDDEVNPLHKPLIAEFNRLNIELSKVWMKSRRYSIKTLCSNIYTTFIFGEYSRNTKIYRDAYTESLERNKPLAPNEIGTRFSVPNLPGLPYVLPHQAEFISSSAKSPKYIALDISAGGGKTIQMIIDIMQQKEKGEINVAFIICPGKLVKEFVGEINQFSKGKINAIPITVSVIKKMVDVMGYDKKAYLNYLKSAPKNTIYVISINFLAGRTDYFAKERMADKLQFGEVLLSFFPYVQLLRQLNPDLIAVDESHYVKNITAKRTQSLFALSPVAEYRRVASGTMMKNDPTDEVSQIAVLNPAILGNKDEYIARYGIAEGGKFARWKAEGAIALAKDRRPFMMKVSKSRRDWAFMLPKINIRFINIPLTPKQMEFYKDILMKAIDAIRNDREIVKILNKGDDKAAEKIEKKIKRSLNVLDEFINAPDANEPFVTASKYNLSPNDLISPKVHAIDGILREHFKNPKANKVIIFSINKKVSEHIFRHSKFSHMGVHYAIANTLENNKSGVAERSTTKGDEALLKFRNNSKVKILFADECFPGYMQVMVDYDKSLSMEDIYKDKSITHVLAYDLNKKKIVKRKLLDKIRRPVKGHEEWLQITVFDKEKNKSVSFEVTDNHWIFLKNGKVIQARDLKVGDETITYCGDFARYPYNEITCINKIQEKDKLGEFKYDLTVGLEHNYFVIAGSFEQNKRGSIPVLVHNTSLREGLNLQMASRIIRVQTPWSPGDHEQAISRAMRPDVKNLYGRESVDIDWLMFKHTLEMPKIARMISKQFMVHDGKEAENPQWLAYKKAKRLVDMELVKMNMDFIESLVTMSNTGFNAGAYLDQYYANYEDLNIWEQNQFDETTNKLRKDTAKRLGISEAEVDLRKDAILKLDGSAVIPGSKSIYVPIENGSRPLDPRNLNLSPLAVAIKVKANDDEDDEDEEDNEDKEDNEDEEDGPVEDIVEYDVGDIVQTEFGFGRITLIRKGRNGGLAPTVKVSVPGFRNGEPFTINKQAVFIPKPPLILEDEHPDYAKSVQVHQQWQRAVKKLQRDFEKNEHGPGLTFMKGYEAQIQIEEAVAPSKKNPNLIKPQAVHLAVKEGTGRRLPEPEENIKPKDRLPQKPANLTRQPKIDVNAMIINGAPALLTYSDEEGFDLIDQHNSKDQWYRVPKHYDVHIQTTKGAENFISLIQELGLNAPPESIDRLRNLATKLKGRANSSNPDQLLVRNPKSMFNPEHLQKGTNGFHKNVAFYDNIRNFISLTHSKPKTANGIRIYPTIWKDELFVSWTIATQPQTAKALYSALRSRKLRGLNNPQMNEDMAVKFFRSAAGATSFLKALRQKIKLNDYDETLNALKDPMFNKLSGY